MVSEQQTYLELALTRFVSEANLLWRRGSGRVKAAHYHHEVDGLKGLGVTAHLFYV